MESCSTGSLVSGFFHGMFSRSIQVGECVALISWYVFCGNGVIWEGLGSGCGVAMAGWSGLRKPDTPLLSDDGSQVGCCWYNRLPFSFHSGLQSNPLPFSLSFFHLSPLKVNVANSFGQWKLHLRTLFLYCVLGRGFSRSFLGKTHRKVGFCRCLCEVLSIPEVVWFQPDVGCFLGLPQSHKPCLHHNRIVELFAFLYS